MVHIERNIRNRVVLPIPLVHISMVSFVANVAVLVLLCSSMFPVLGFAVTVGLAVQAVRAVDILDYVRQSPRLVIRGFLVRIAINAFVGPRVVFVGAAVRMIVAIHAEIYPNVIIVVLLILLVLVLGRGMVITDRASDEALASAVRSSDPTHITEGS